MGGLFSIDGKLFSALDKLANVVLLNLLFIICCIPIVTIGASTTALFYVSFKVVKNEEGYIIRSFFHSFKQNFKQSTVIWLLALFMGIVLYADYFIIMNIESSFSKVMLVLLGMVGIIYTFVMVYIFPVLAKFENTIRRTIINALLISIRHLPYTILLIVLILLPFAAVFLNSMVLALIMIMGFGGIAFYTSFFYLKIFDHYIPKEEAAEEEIEAKELLGK